MNHLWNIINIITGSTDKIFALQKFIDWQHNPMNHHMFYWETSIDITDP